MEDGRRDPAWSRPLTRWLAERVPPEGRSATLRGIKAVHTTIFVSIAALIVLVVVDGALGQPCRRTAIALGIALTESAVFASNNLVCPLTPLAEDLGAASGSVTDIYLPGWVSRRIPVLSGSLLMIGLALNLRAWAAGRASRSGRSSL